MKKSCLYALVVILLLVSSALFAEESDFYTKSVPISIVYPHKLGYKIVYLKSDMTYSAVYVPLKWFQTGEAKGDLVLGDDKTYPYFSIFWENGIFHHIRLYLKKDMRDPSWGDLAPDKNIDDKFKVETLDLNF